MEKIESILNLQANNESKHFKKGDILQREGDTNFNTFYIVKGLLKAYTIDTKGKEHIFMFAPEGWIAADTESQEFKKPAELFIECIEDSEVIIIQQNLLSLPELTLEQYKLNTEMLARRIAVLQRRVIMLMSASALERYERFLVTYPNLPNRVPQRLIASYLGVTPQALSTIRGEMVKKK